MKINYDRILLLFMIGFCIYQSIHTKPIEKYYFINNDKNYLEYINNQLKDRPSVSSILGKMTR